MTQQRPSTEDANHEDEENDTSPTRGAWIPATGKGKKKNTCKGGPKVCGLPLAGKDCIRCDGCKQWYHPKCQDLSMEAFAAISKYEFLWLCLECKPHLMTMLETGKKVSERVSEAENKIMTALNELTSDGSFKKQIDSRIAMIEKSFVELKEQQSRVETSIKEQKEAVQEMPKVTQDLRSSASQLKKIVESRDKEDRETNVILHNIPESKSEDNEVRKKYDVDSLYNVASALLGDTTGVEVQQVIRLGKRPEAQGDASPEPRARLLLVKLKNKSMVNNLIKRRTQLKDVGFPNIYLTRDLSPEEREKQRGLREELESKGRDTTGRRTHVIFRGKVIPRN